MFEPKTLQEKADAYDKAMEVLSPTIKEKMIPLLGHDEQLLMEAIVALNMIYDSAKKLPILLEAANKISSNKEKKESPEEVGCSLYINFKLDDDHQVKEVAIESDSYSIKILYIDNQWKLLREDIDQLVTAHEFSDFIPGHIDQKDEIEFITFSVFVWRVFILLDLSGTREEAEIKKYGIDISGVIQQIVSDSETKNEAIRRLKEWK